MPTDVGFWEHPVECSPQKYLGLDLLRGSIVHGLPITINSSNVGDVNRVMIKPLGPVNHLRDMSQWHGYPIGLYQDMVARVFPPSHLFPVFFYSGYRGLMCRCSAMEHYSADFSHDRLVK